MYKPMLLLSTPLTPIITQNHRPSQKLISNQHYYGTKKITIGVKRILQFSVQNYFRCLGRLLSVSFLGFFFVCVSVLVIICVCGVTVPSFSLSLPPFPPPPLLFLLLLLRSY